MHAESCGRPLANGKKCCRTEGHPLGGRHCHTWQQADARYVEIDEKLIDMETGEVVGYCGDAARRIIEEIVGERITQPEPSPEEKQVHARRVLETMYGATFPDETRPVHAAPPHGYEWHYEGTYKAYGTTGNGHNVEFDFTTGKVKRIYSLNQRKTAIAYARRYGAAASARKFDIPPGTIYGWIGRRTRADHTKAA